MSAARYRTFAEFWPFYLGEHRKPATRAFHVFGTSCAFAFVVAVVVTRQWLLIPAGLVNGYFWAWVSHFFVEKNRPATFQYPLWSFAGDWKMWALWLTRRLDGELERVARSP